MHVYAYTNAYTYKETQTHARFIVVIAWALSLVLQKLQNFTPTFYRIIATQPWNYVLKSCWTASIQAKNKSEHD